jgi:aryl-alcohol dehydrogenase-like predicted oxidoreductase
MKSGLLTGKMTRERVAALPADDFRRRAPHFQEPLLTRNLALVDLLTTIAHRHGRTPGEIAIAWVLCHPAVTGAIVGMRSAEQARQVLGAAEVTLTAEDLGEINAFRGDHHY